MYKFKVVKKSAENTESIKILAFLQMLMTWKEAICISLAAITAFRHIL